MRPADTAEVAGTLRACARRRRPGRRRRAATPAWSAAACRVACRWSCSRRAGSTALGPVDDGAACRSPLGAGVTLARWRRHAQAAGLDAPVDFASRDSATVGGAVATNAGGSRVVRFGTMRVAGRRRSTAVLADGSDDRLAGRAAEGDGRRALAVAAGRQRGHARRRSRPPACGSCRGTATRPRRWWRRRASTTPSPCSPRLRAAVPHLDAVELILPEAMAVVAAHLGAAPPVGGEGTGAYVIVECADHDDPTDELTAALAGRARGPRRRRRRPRGRSASG